MVKLQQLRSSEFILLDRGFIKKLFFIRSKHILSYQQSYLQNVDTLGSKDFHKFWWTWKQNSQSGMAVAGLITTIEKQWVHFAWAGLHKEGVFDREQAHCNYLEKRWLGTWSFEAGIIMKLLGWVELRAEAPQTACCCSFKSEEPEKNHTFEVFSWSALYTLLPAWLRKWHFYIFL